MPRSAPIQSSFNSGEISPWMYGRIDKDAYHSGMRKLLNHLPLIQGPTPRRPGTIFVEEVKDSTQYTRLQRFKFSVTQAYILEFGNLYMRMYRTHGQVKLTGTPVEIVTPYTTADLDELMFTQSDDTLYVTHQSYAPLKIGRTSDTTWTIAVINFQDGPYLDVNTGAITFSIDDATVGTGHTLTASAPTFASTDVGRHFRMQTASAAWGWGTITAFTNNENVTVTVVEAIGASATTTTLWRLGKWSVTTGYPACSTFFQDRLGFGGTASTPESADFSCTGSYELFSPTAFDVAGTVSDSDALSFTLNSQDVQLIRWMSGDANGLLIGTVSGEWLVSPSTLNTALTPTNINAKQMTAYGSAQTNAIRVGYTTLMLQRSMRKIRELTFVYYENKYHAPDLTVLGQHLTKGGLKQMDYQQEPGSLLWAPRISDGTVICMTYDRDQNVVALTPHVLGGVSDADGTQTVVESLACIPSPDASLGDEVWFVAKRWIGGEVKRYIEYLTPMWEDGDDPVTAVHLDCSLVYQGSPTKSFSNANHVAGETVSIWADGSVHPDVVVGNDGSFDLNRSASTVVMGYGYNSDGQTLRNDAGAGDGTAQGKTQRKHRVAFRVLDTLGLSAGPNFDELTEEIDRVLGDALGQAVGLYTGDMQVRWEGDYSTDDTICWRFSSPAPGTMIAIMPLQDTEDR